MSFIGIAGIKIKRAGLSPGLLIFLSCTQILPRSRMFFMSPDALYRGRERSESRFIGTGINSVAAVYDRRKPRSVGL
jgi:hypothetical protein